jgi:hypothetical protein
MKIACGVLGCALGIFITNSLWVTKLPDRPGNTIFAGAFFILLMFAIKYNWDGDID